MINLNGKLLFGTKSSSSVSFKGTSGSNVSAAATSLKTNGDMWIGSGTTPASVNDYDMESRVTTLQKSNQSMANATAYGDDFVMTLTATFVNTTGSDVSISELGWIAAASSSQYESAGIMIAHESITPVVIPAGESKTFTISVG